MWRRYIKGQREMLRRFPRKDRGMVKKHPLFELTGSFERLFKALERSADRMLKKLG